MVPVVPGKWDVQRDFGKAKCAACGTVSFPRTLIAVGGIPLSLCVDPYLCRMRWEKR